MRARVELDTAFILPEHAGFEWPKFTRVSWIEKFLHCLSIF